MSVQAMSWALKQQRVKAAPARHVLLCLANYAHDDGTAAFPSQATLAKETGLNERTVRSRLAEMELLGIIRRGNQAIAAAHIAREDRRPVVYDLDMREGLDSSRPARGESHVVTGGISRPKRGGSAPADPRPLSINDPGKAVDISTEKRKRKSPAETAGQLRNISELFKVGTP